MSVTRQLTAADVHAAGDTARPNAREEQRSQRRVRTAIPPRVLLIDVDPISRARFGRALVTPGVDVSIARTTDEAIEALHQRDFDAVALLTSTSDAALDVVDLLESIARLAPHAAIVARSRTPDAYELFLRSFGFRRTAVFAWDAPNGAKQIREFAEQCAVDL